MNDCKMNKQAGQTKAHYEVCIKEDGTFALPQEIIKKLGFTKTKKVRLTLDDNKVELLPNIHSLAKVYIEPTAKCNLACSTCIRNTWNEKMGEMNIQIFDQLIDQLKDFEDIQSVMFGGFGEPTFHKDILYMIGEVKSLGLKVEMVTNGTLLDENLIKGLIEKGLDVLWVSFDGTDTERFRNIRKGGNFDQIVQSLGILKSLNRRSAHKVEVGIAFVATKANIQDLKKIHRLARAVDAKKISISNVLPYSKEMKKEMLYAHIIDDDPAIYSSMEPAINIPRMPFNEMTKESLYSLFKFHHNISFVREPLNINTKTCRFIKDRCTFIRWDGKVSPCMGLLHSYTTYMHHYERTVKSHVFGDIKVSRLYDIWHSQEYHHFRNKVDTFDFSPCHICGGCEYLESNEEDCFGNTFPTCGACLWAHGFIQCP